MSKVGAKTMQPGGIDPKLYTLGLICFTLSILGPRLAEQLSFPRNEAKRFESFEAFYPYYIEQHSDETCKHLHFIGSIIVLIMAVLDRYVFVALMMAACSGYGAMHLTRWMDNGTVEFCTMMMVYFLAMKRLNNVPAKVAMRVPLVGYAFAWAGHRFFEQNEPATFIYPVYSLMGDYRMLYDFFNDSLLSSAPANVSGRMQRGA
jgi:hypothetical protein